MRQATLFEGARPPFALSQPSKEPKACALGQVQDMLTSLRAPATRCGAALWPFLSRVNEQVAAVQLAAALCNGGCGPLHTFKLHMGKPPGLLGLTVHSCKQRLLTRLVCITRLLYCYK